MLFSDDDAICFRKKFSVSKFRDIKQQLYVVNRKRSCVILSV